MLEYKELLGLAKTVAKADPSVAVCYSQDGKNLTYSAANETLREELNALAGDFKSYRENKNTLFSLIEEVMDEILPKKVIEQYGAFAEVKTFAQGDKPVFKKKTGRTRAKQFITRVGLAGRYEVFKLGMKVIEVPTSAIGGAAQIGIEEFLDGRADFSELVQIVLEGMDEVVYQEIAKVLIAGISELPTANKVSAAGFSETDFDNLIAVSSAYGTPTIYCTQEFASKIAPADKWLSNAMKDERWANGGHFTTYKGHRIIVLPQSFTDETNSTKVIDPSYCWIMPGSDDKPVKVAFEGATLVDERANDDWSRDIQVYRKLGVIAIMTNNICVYEDTQL